MGSLVFLVLILGALGFYFLPTLVAGANHNRNGVAIFALNLLLGWTMLGWIVALVWALTRDPVTVVAPSALRYPTQPNTLLTPIALPPSDDQSP